MRKFIVLLEYPKVISQEIEAKNENDLLRKIETDQYNMLPIHGNKAIIITKNNIDKIYEQSPCTRLKDFAVKNVDMDNFKKGIFWNFYKFMMQKIYNLGRWDDLLERLKKERQNL